MASLYELFTRAIANNSLETAGLDKEEQKLRQIIPYKHMKPAKKRVKVSDILKAKKVTVPTETSLSYCPECKIPMKLATGELRCDECGLVMEGLDAQFYNDETTTPKNMMINVKGRIYSISNDYARAQRDTIAKYLHDKNNEKFAIGEGIINRVIEDYNQLQQIQIEEAGSTSKFVRRGKVRDELIAVLMYNECNRQGTPRKKKDITAYMNLDREGFASGEVELRMLVSKGYFNYEFCSPNYYDYIRRYLKALHLENYEEFVIEVVQYVEDNNLCLSSQICSIIAGTIWLIIKRLKIVIKQETFNSAIDNIKRNTYMKVEERLRTNSHIDTICERYGIATNKDLIIGSFKK